MTHRRYHTKILQGDWFSILRYNVFVETAPVYDSTGSYQATGGALSSNDIRRFIDTNSYSTQHYAFLTGSDGGGAIGIAYLGTCCFRNSNGKL